MTVEERWAQVVRTWVAPSEEASAAVLRALVEAEESGARSCLHHEIHQWVQENVELPLCPHCQGPADPRLGFHNLCAEYAKRGREITRRLDVRSACSCWPCRQKAGEPS
jgi:hypothetical protein